MQLNNIIEMLYEYDIQISNKIINNIMFELNNLKKNKSNIHVSFLIDSRSKDILSYGLNFYYKEKSFPFSIHAEINTVNKYYKRDINNTKKNKKLLFIFKLSKTGVIGLSRPCKTCANYLYNNFSNLNLINIYYSTINNNLIMLKQNDLLNHNEFKYSSGRTRDK